MKRLRYIIVVFAGCLFSCGETEEEENLGGEVRDRNRVVTDQVCPVHEKPLWKIESHGETICYAQPYGDWLHTVDVQAQFPFAIIGERNLRRDHSSDADFPMYYLACEECEKSSSESWDVFAALHTKQPAEQGESLKP